MSAETELIRRLIERETVPVDLVAEVDPLDLAELVERFLRWPLAPDVAAALVAPPVGPAGAAAGPQTVAPTPPVIFARAVAAGDPSAVDMAATVDPMAVAFLAIRALAMPATSDPLRVLDVLLLVEHEQALGGA